MSDQEPKADTLSPVKRALLEIRELKAQLARLERGQREPVAIVGMGLRFPGGATDPDSFARLLWSGTDAITTIPDDRWSLDALYNDDPDRPGTMTTRYGGFIDGIDSFDAAFFGISPREAASMDPQQRLLLEVTWHAIENAGQAPSGLAGSRTGVYLGICNNDYGRALFQQQDLIDAHISTGNASSVASGRLSYFLGLRGPSIAVDTACSSSLVALHLAVQGLRLRECDQALVGGINLILTPEMNISFSKARMMAADGRCKTFDAAADGYVRSEGCAVLVLRRLSDALADGDRVLAVVRGSAINQDGRSAGLTAPNGPAQEDVIQAALANAGVAAQDVDYVEAHGTGTSLGDPIEVGALTAVLCAGRSRSRPLLIGSVKTNIGHLEAAAGLAGVIKVVLAFARQEIPPNLHLRTGNPMINWTAPIAVPTVSTPWVSQGKARIAGVSSFGFSGTNAHAILEEAPEVPTPQRGTVDRPAHLLALSARDATSLVELAARYDELLTVDTAVGDLCFTANTGRSHFDHRIAVVGKNADELRKGLTSFRSGTPMASVAIGRTVDVSLAGDVRRPSIGFLFTGQGAQSAGMGRVLYETSPVFRDALDACAAGLQPYMRRGLFDVMFGEESSTINEAEYAQPATFALQYALARLWRSWGVEPAVVLGHSLGEYAAACVAGLFSLEDGLRLVAERGRLSQQLAGTGAMGTIFAPADQVEETLASVPGDVTIAAYNGPAHVVVSGIGAAVDTVLAHFESRGIQTKRLRVNFAAHSRFVEPLLPSFRTVLEQVRWQEPRLAVVSNVTGTVAPFDQLKSVAYWLDHYRQPVRFGESIQAALSQGISHFIEIGPHPVLSAIGAENAGSASVEWLPSLRRDSPDWSDLLSSVQRLYVDRAQIDWNGFDRGYERQRVPAPTYPFRRKRHWLDLGGHERINAATRWDRVVASAARQAESGPLDLNASSYPAKWDVLARLVSAHARAFLKSRGVFATAGEVRTLDAVLGAAHIDKRYRHLISRWLDRLVAEGTLREENGAFTAPSPLEPVNLTPLWAEAERLFVDNQPLLAYVRHCGQLLERVLTGQESPLETLFPGGSWELAEGLYERSTTMRYVNGLAGAMADALSRSTPAGRTLRVMEIGAGTGGTTSALLPMLDAENTRYQFTDISDVFLDRARNRFARFPFVDYRRFDLGRDLASQGYAPGTMDVIYSANAVHASANLRRALGLIRELLAPGGVLVLIESTTHLAWFDMTTGLIEGWQHFSDDLRIDNPLLSAERWMEALKQEGFETAAAWPAQDSAASSLGQHVIVAKMAGEPFGSAVVSPVDMLVEVATTHASAPPVASELLRHRLLDVVASNRIGILRDLVRDHVVRVLRLAVDEAPGRHDRLMDAGFDSLMAVQLRNQLTEALGLEKTLPASLIFDHPTIESLAEYLLGCVMPAERANETPTELTDTISDRSARTAGVAAMTDAEVEALLLERLEKQ